MELVTGYELHAVILCILASTIIMVHHGVQLRQAIIEWNM